MKIYYYKSDNLLEVDELKNKITGAYINNATVTCTVVDDQGVQVSGETWPITLNYVAASNGKYRGNLKDTLNVSLDRYYYAEITADAGTDLKRFWRIQLFVQFDQD